MDGDTLKSYIGIPDCDDRQAALRTADGPTMSTILSHLLTGYDFNSWQYDVISEACERLHSIDTSTEIDEL